MQTITITKIDGAQETVTIRQLGIRHAKPLAEAISLSDEVSQIKLFTAQDDQWVDSLSNDSAFAILRKGHELNADFIASWIAMQGELMATLAQKLPRAKA